MDNSYCNEECGNFAASEKKSYNFKELLVFGGFVAYVLLTSALIIYGTLQGYNVDPDYLL